MAQARDAAWQRAKPKLRYRDLKLVPKVWAPAANGAAKPQAKYQDRKQVKKDMNRIMTKDEPEIYFKDWGNRVY